MVQAEWGREGGPDPEGLESLGVEEARTDRERHGHPACRGRPHPHPGREAPGAPAGALALDLGEVGFGCSASAQTATRVCGARAHPTDGSQGHQPASRAGSWAPGQAQRGPHHAFELLRLSAGCSQPPRSSEQQHPLSACSPVSRPPMQP